MEKVIASVSCRTGVGVPDLLETPLPILDEMVRLLLKEQQERK